MQSDLSQVTPQNLAVFTVRYQYVFASSTLGVRLILLGAQYSMEASCQLRRTTEHATMPSRGVHLRMGMGS